MDRSILQKTFSSLVLCDITPGGISTKSSDALTPFSMLEALNTYSLAPHKFFPSESTTTEAEFADTLEHTDFRSRLIVVGHQDDPLAQPEKTFHRYLQLMEHVAAVSSATLLFQTRSPMILLALPILQSFGPNLVVRLAFDGVTDPISQRYFSRQPLCSERLTTLQTLANLGICCAVQVSPFFGMRVYPNALRAFAMKLACFAEHIELLDPVDYFCGTPVAHNNLHTQRRWCDQLSTFLLRLAPEKLIGPTTHVPSKTKETVAA